MTSFESLRTQLRGELITPESSEYDAARRLWNGMVDKRPAGIARCSGVADVVACVRYAAEHNVLLAIRGGGHNVAVACNPLVRSSCNCFKAGGNLFLPQHEQSSR